MGLRGRCWEVEIWKRILGEVLRYRGFLIVGLGGWELLW